MGSRSRTAIAALTITLSALTLSGCGFLEPTRDVDGRITKPTTMPTIDAWVDDCFSFVENSGLAYVSVVPCSEQHSYIVMGRGSFSEAELELAGGRDNAVNGACDTVYDEFIAAVEGRGKPAKQSIISAEEEDEGLVTYYSCVAEDTVVVDAIG